MAEQDDITYVYEDTEVRLTGRTAIRTTTRDQTVTLYEITPVNQLIVGSWLKWVRMDVLYVIRGT